MRILISSLLALMLLSPVLQGQKPAIAEADLPKLKEWEDTISLLSFAIINDSFPENRFGATKKMIPTLVQALKTPNSFQYPFSRAQSISIQYPEDSTFRVFTWQLYVDVDEYRYFGAIQMNTGELQLFPLIDRSFDVLSFPDGKPQFGAPVFYNEEKEGGVKVRNRLLFEYSAEASVKCNYDPLMEMVVVDHLVEVGGFYEGQGATKIPDGSYEGYQLIEGIWKNISMLENTIVEEPPRPFPVLDGDDGVDILGRKKQ
jgi:hypothetical protein